VQRVFPGEYLDVPMRVVIDEARSGNRRADGSETAFPSRVSQMSTANRSSKKRNAVFDTVRVLEKAHIGFDIVGARSDALTIRASIVGKRIEIDVFEDNHIEISRFRGNESIEGGSELLIEIVTAELRENYPERLSEIAAK